MYIVSGHFQFDKESLNHAQKCMDDMLALGKTEPGNLSYMFYRDPHKLNSFFLFEEWLSKEAHDAHFNGNSMKKMLPEFFALLEGKPKVTYYDAKIESTI